MPPPQEAIDSLGLKVRATFIPLSKSRNAGGDPAFPTLNWSVTLVQQLPPRGDSVAHHDVLTTDYSAGCAHCPAYRRKPPLSWDRPLRDWQPLACAWECENGHAAAYYSFSHAFTKDVGRREYKGAILPSDLDVIYSLVQDADVLDAGGFAEWCGNYGYDSDSIKAKTVYDSCLEIALKLRSAVGDAGIETLREAFQDY